MVSMITLKINETRTIRIIGQIKYQSLMTSSATENTTNDRKQKAAIPKIKLPSKYNIAFIIIRLFYVIQI